MSLNCDLIIEAVQFVSDGESYGNKAYLEKSSGKIYYYNGFEQLPEYEELPEDILSNRFIEIPTLKELDLKHALIFDFARVKLPDFYDKIREIFNHKGAYKNYRRLLIKLDALEEWFKYENKITGERIQEWCRENDLQHFNE